MLHNLPHLSAQVGHTLRLLWTEIAHELAHAGCVVADSFSELLAAHGLELGRSVSLH
jgi:hypothetical protein